MNTIVAMLAGAALTGSVYMAGWGTCRDGASGVGDTCVDCAPVSRAEAMTGNAALVIPAGYVDMKNTKCIVQGEDIGGMGPGAIVTYEGKAYHTCCTACVATFNKEPEKYVKAFEADPAKFGVAK